VERGERDPCFDRVGVKREFFPFRRLIDTRTDVGGGVLAYSVADGLRPAFLSLSVEVDMIRKKA